MPKRRKEDSDSESDFEDTRAGSDSDASFTAKTRKAPSKPRKQSPNKRTKTTVPVEVDVCSTTTWQHAQSAHAVQNVEDVRTALLSWYALVRETRGMPWRKPFDSKHDRAQRAQRAYEVWISEIMLQQTQVATVIPYYNRWMGKFPTIAALAEANMDDVNTLWKGLGYYSRASRLLAGAQKVMRELGGYLPDNAKDMEAKIPGIGRYSAGAICSIAYGEKVPVLDGNVHRLLSRFLLLHANPKSKATLDILWTGAAAMVDVKGYYEDAGYQNPGDINQALIELGSTVCKVQNPTCLSCPLKDHCSAYQKSPSTSQIPGPSTEIGDIEDLCTVCEPLPTAFDVTMLPMKAEKKKAREETDFVNVVEWRATPGSTDRWFLLTKRPEKGLLAGLYEFPTLSNVSEPDSQTRRSQAPVEVLSTLLVSPVRRPDALSSASKFFERGKKGKDSADGGSVEISQIKPVGDVLHLFSHVKKTYRAQWVLLEGGVSPPALDLKTKGKKAKENVNEAGPRKKANAKGKSSKLESVAEAEGGLCLDDLRWVRMEDVDHANISTGMVKVWKLANSKW
ncbi:DNA glycosylase [Ephemerocybe angulata]|uniref:Adenine DNA glycosylase n=1 Tax=Ephemerocybe angulata TaxID=980116 RepID=A0A8H6HIU5_9AGAR|nr:DNA glycosylase [Tulosesus angulatus]